MQSSPVRRTQLQRTEATRHKLLEATIACLVEVGYSRTTTTEVVARAGVSQGALFKHFANKSKLMAAAAAHLFGQLSLEYDRRFAELAAGDDLAAAGFDLLWDVYRSAPLAASFELYMAARTDPELAAELHPVVQQQRADLVSHSRALFPDAARGNPAFDSIVDLLMCAMGGIVLERFGAGDVGDVGDDALAQLRSLAMLALNGGK